MARTAIARRTALPVRRSAGSVSKSKYESIEARLGNAQKRLNKALTDDGDAMIGVGAAIALAVLEKPDPKTGKGYIPNNVMGFDSALAVGALGYYFTRKGKSATMRGARQASIVLAGIGANRSTMRGSIRTEPKAATVAGEYDADL